MFQTPRHRSARIVALVAGLACTSAAFAQMPSFDLTNVTWLQGQGLTGSGVLIGQHEDGFAANHTGFLPRYTYQQGGTTGGVNAHATGVASIMLGSAAVYGGVNVTGIAPGASLAASFAGGGGAPHFAGLDWQMLNPASDVINISWGGPAVGSPDPDTTAVDWASNQSRKLYVKSAGNQGNGGTITSPGDGFNVLTVGATGRGGTNSGNTNYRRVAEYSSTGPTGPTGNTGLRKPDLVAPGSFILKATNADLNGNGATDDYTQATSGTSFAAPHVAGVSALLQGYAIGKSWEAAGKNNMTQRAVLINGTSKNVYDRNNARWDSALPRPAAQPLDTDTGAGLLDARRSYEIFKDGPTTASVRYDSNGFPVYGIGNVPNQGWAKDSIIVNTETGESKWTPDANLRKGSYLTATLAWERQTTINPPLAPTSGNASYSRELGDLGLNIRKNSDNSLVGSSDTSNNSVEHAVVKVPQRDRYQIAVRKFNNPSEEFALAWHAYAAPTTIRDFNGDFMGDRGALNDNGWFNISTHGSSSVLRPAFTSQTADASFAMSILPDSMGLPAGMAQELVTPTSGFWLRFDLAFSGALNSHTLGVQLGGVDILAAAGIANGLILPEAANTNQYKTYTIDLSNNQGIFAGLTGGFQDLSFLGVGYGGGRINIDNISYVPTPATLALLSLGLLTAARRRR